MPGLMESFFASQEELQCFREDISLEKRQVCQVSLVWKNHKVLMINII